MRKRSWMILGAAAILIALILGSWATQCRVTTDKLTISPVKMIFVPVPEGFAAGVRFNVTNHLGCELEAASISVTIRTVTYTDGSSDTLGATESQLLSQPIQPEGSSSFSYVFNSIFAKQPARMALAIQLNFRDAGSVTIFDGELVA